MKKTRPVSYEELVEELKTFLSGLSNVFEHIHWDGTLKYDCAEKSNSFTVLITSPLGRPPKIHLVIKVTIEPGDRFYALAVTGYFENGPDRYDLDEFVSHGESLYDLLWDFIQPVRHLVRTNLKCLQSGNL